MNGEWSAVNSNQPIKRSMEFFRTFWRMNQSVRRIVQKTAADNGLTVPQYALLMAIAPRKEMTQKELGKVLQFPKSTLSQSVAGLVQAGLLVRHPVEDNRREMQLILSEQGKVLYDSMMEQEGSITHSFESAIQTLSDKQYDDLLEAILQISIYLEKADEGEIQYDKNTEKPGSL